MGSHLRRSGYRYIEPPVPDQIQDALLVRCSCVVTTRQIRGKSAAILRYVCGTIAAQKWEVVMVNGCSCGGAADIAIVKKCGLPIIYPSILNLLYHSMFEYNKRKQEFCYDFATVLL